MMQMSSRSSNPQVGVYCIQHGDIIVYVGGSVDIANRATHHRYMLRRRLHKCKPLQQLWTEYGEDSFRFLVLEDCSREELPEREQFWLTKHSASILNKSKTVFWSGARK